METWIEHPDHPTYFFSSLGRCRRDINGKIKYIVGTKCGGQRKCGGVYRSIVFHTGNKEKIYLHRIICTLFNGGDGDGLHCRHLDGDVDNYAASNLAWGTAKDNHNDRIMHGRSFSGENNPMSKLSMNDVLEMRAIRKEKNIPYSKIAIQFGVSTMTALRAIKLEAWK